MLRGLCSCDFPFDFTCWAGTWKPWLTFLICSDQQLWPFRPQNIPLFQSFHVYIYINIYIYIYIYCIYNNPMFHIFLYISILSTFMNRLSSSSWDEIQLMFPCPADGPPVIWAGHGAGLDGHFPRQRLRCHELHVLVSTGSGRSWAAESTCPSELLVWFSTWRSWQRRKASPLFTLLSRKKGIRDIKDTKEDVLVNLYTSILSLAHLTKLN